MIGKALSGLSGLSGLIDAAASLVAYLLLESGDYLLLEDGSKILKE